MSIQRAVLNTFAGVLAEENIWAHAKALVAAIENTNPEMSGSEKRAAVYQDLLLIAEDIAKPILHLLIEMSVIYLKGL